MIEKTVIRNTEIGTFILCDAGFLELYGGKPKTIIRVPNGNYHADISVKSKSGTFYPAAKMKRHGLLQINTGRLFVGDPNEAFRGRGGDRHWNTFLNATGFMKSVPSMVKVIDTGGDGVGVIKFTLTKQSGWKSDRFKGSIA